MIELVIVWALLVEHCSLINDQLCAWVETARFDSEQACKNEAASGGTFRCEQRYEWRKKKDDEHEQHQRAR